MSHFTLTNSTKASDVIPVRKFVSQKTGLTVIIAETEGPIVNGIFCLATEIQDDDCAALALERLTFFGSKRYPYKGFLRLLANRCMAHGVDAWSFRGRTSYSISTVGDAGMLTLLPVYMDHILNPALTEEGFLMEVHHVNGDGEDAGAIYCQIQREDNSIFRCERQMLRAMYPGSGYSAESHGIVENLRTSTNIAKVIDFHKKFYRPENLTIVLSGQVEPDDVFKALAVVEDDLMAKKEEEKLEECLKPWLTMPPPPTYSEIKLQWPADAEEYGQRCKRAFDSRVTASNARLHRDTSDQQEPPMLFGWRGPEHTEPNAMKDLTGCAVLLRYLCDTAAAPLQRCLVEREDALAGGVFYDMNESIASKLGVNLENVPLAKLEAAKDETKKCLASVRAGDEALDMERLRRLLRKQVRERQYNMETRPHFEIAFPCMAAALYSEDEQNFVSRLNPQHSLQELLEESSEYWAGLLQRFFTDEMVVIVGSPSIELQAKKKEDEKKRIETQKAELGDRGLAEKAKQLADAIEFNSRPPPPGLIAAVPVPEIDNLRCHQIASWSSDTGECPHFDFKEVPLYARVHSLKTDFVYLTTMLDVTSAEQQTRKWLPLLVSSVAECPVRRGGDLIPHEEVITTTEQLTFMFQSNFGFYGCGPFSPGNFGNYVRISVRCEPQDYEEVVNHLYEVLYTAELTKERLLAFARKLLNEVVHMLSYGHCLANDLLNDSIYSQDSSQYWCSLLRQQKFLKELIKQLNASDDSADAAVLEASQHFKTMTEKAWLHLATDFERYQLSTEPWKKFARGDEVAPLKPTLGTDAYSGWGGGAIAGVGGLEEAHVLQSSPGPKGCDAECAPLKVALSYFTQTEGPLWRAICDSAQATFFQLGHADDEERLTFSLYYATSLVTAYAKAKGIIDEFLSSGTFDDELFASARSTALSDALAAENSPEDVVRESLMNFVRQGGEDYNNSLIRAIASVTPEAAHAAAARWLPTLFDAAQSKMAVVCHPTKVADMQQAFDKINVKLDAFESMEAFHSGE